MAGFLQVEAQGGGGGEQLQRRQPHQGETLPEHFHATLCVGGMSNDVELELVGTNVTLLPGCSHISPLSQLAGGWAAPGWAPPCPQTSQNTRGDTGPTSRPVRASTPQGSPRPSPGASATLPEGRGAGRGYVSATQPLPQLRPTEDTGGGWPGFRGTERSPGREGLKCSQEAPVGRNPTSLRGRDSAARSVAPN